MVVTAAALTAAAVAAMDAAAPVAMDVEAVAVMDVDAMEAAPATAIPAVNTNTAGKKKPLTKAQWFKKIGKVGRMVRNGSGKGRTGSGGFKQTMADMTARNAPNAGDLI